MTMNTTFCRLTLDFLSQISFNVVVTGAAVVCTIVAVLCTCRVAERTIGSDQDQNQDLIRTRVRI